MFPYIGLVWSSDEKEQQETADRLRARIRQRLIDWRIVLDVPGMFVSVAPSPVSGLDEIHLLPNSAGVVLGKLFYRSYVESESTADVMPEKVRFDTALTARIVDSSGINLGGEVWGAYTAFLRDPVGREQWVMRDPTGKIPCSFTDLHGVSVYFLRLLDIRKVEDIRLDINQHFMIGMFAGRSHHSGETGYEGIMNVLPGERITHRQGRITRAFYWDPVEIARTGPEIDATEAKVATRRLVRACVHAWASSFDSIYLQLSGGFDSTVVAACLVNAPNRPNVICANYYSEHESSDERSFARAVARQCGFELLEIVADKTESVELTSRNSGTVVPTEITASGNSWLSAMRMMAARGIKVHLRGDGGDELFYRGGRFPDSVDYAYKYGVTSRLWRIAYNDAMIERSSIWEVLSDAIRLGLLKRPYASWREPDWLPLRLRFLTKAVRDCLVADSSHWHPLYRQLPDCPPAKLLQSYQLLNFTNVFYSEPSGESHPVMIAPLLSQPHMELALRTPVYVLRAGGRDRARARDAFEDEIPKSIVNRRYKSLASRKFIDWLAPNSARIRSMLLDGYLAESAIVDRHAIESYLSKVPTYVASLSPHLRMLVGIEIWAQAVAHRGAIAA